MKITVLIFSLFALSLSAISADNWNVTQPIRLGLSTRDAYTCALCMILMGKSGVQGVHDLYLKFTGGEGMLFNLNWWQFNK